MFNVGPSDRGMNPQGPKIQEGGGPRFGGMGMRSQGPPLGQPPQMQQPPMMRLPMGDNGYRPPNPGLPTSFPSMGGGMGGPGGMGFQPPPQFGGQGVGPNPEMIQRLMMMFGGGPQNRIFGR